jgi:hypothetical protein
VRLSVPLQRTRLGLLRFSQPRRVSIGDPYAQIFIDAGSIAFTQQDLCAEDCDGPVPLDHGRFCRKRALGLVVGGGWHTKVKPHRPSRNLLYEALAQRYHGLADWGDTLFIKEVEAIISAGKPAWNKCRTMQDVALRCRRADELIDSIKRHGFQVTEQPIRVNIGPSGDFIKNGNGRHRIALGVITQQKIPVQVLVRHRDWESIRRRHASGEQKHPDHPDLPQYASRATTK